VLASYLHSKLIRLYIEHREQNVLKKNISYYDCSLLGAMISSKTWKSIIVDRNNAKGENLRW